jgi:hypothetical protein
MRKSAMFRSLQFLQHDRSGGGIPEWRMRRKERQSIETSALSKGAEKKDEGRRRKCVLQSHGALSSVGKPGSPQMCRTELGVQSPAVGKPADLCLLL